MSRFRPHSFALWSADQQVSHQVLVSDSEITHRGGHALVAVHHAKQFDFHNTDGTSVIDLVSVVQNLVLAQPPENPNRCLYSQANTVTVVANPEAREKGITLIDTELAADRFNLRSELSFGSAFFLRAAGEIKTTGPNNNLQLKLVAGDTFVLNTGMFRVPALNIVRGWFLEVQFVCTRETIVAVGTFSHMNNRGLMVGWCGQTTCDLRAAVGQRLDLTAMWSNVQESTFISCSTLTFNKVM